MKKKLVIGCDFDGTLTDLFSFYKVYGQKAFNKEIVDKTKYGLEGMFDVTKKDVKKFGIQYFIKYCKDKNIREGASKILMDEKKQGSSIHAITARKFAVGNNIFNKYMRKLVKEYARFNGIEFDTYEFADETYTLRDKYAACNKLGVDIMIDDLPEVAMYLANKGIAVALIDTPYNKKVKHKNITRCHSFNDVEKVIEKVKKNLPNIDENFKPLSSSELSKLKNKELSNYYLQYKENLKTEEINKQIFEKGKKRYNVLSSIINMLYLNRFFVKVKNKENVLYQDGVIVVSNHLDSKDQFLVAYALKGKYLTGYASSTIEHTLRAKLAKYTNSAIFVDRLDNDSKKKAKREFDKRLVSGYNSLVFPEGTRKNKYKETENKELLEFKLGAFSSAKITGAPVLPIAIYKKNNTSKKSTIIIGEVFYVEKDEDLKLSAKKCEKIIKQMLRKERKNETNNKR